MNWILLFPVALIPIALGFVWYSPFLFARSWMKAADVTPERLKSGNMVVTLLVSYILSLMLSSILVSVVIHQTHVGSLLMGSEGFGVPGSDVQNLFDQIMKEHGTNFRSFKHGALHGVISAIFFVLPVIGINALFERRSFKYVAIHASYWLITLGLMGGVICGYM